MPYFYSTDQSAYKINVSYVATNTSATVSNYFAQPNWWGNFMTKVEVWNNWYSTGTSAYSDNKAWGTWQYTDKYMTPVRPLRQRELTESEKAELARQKEEEEREILRRARSIAGEGSRARQREFRARRRARILLLENLNEEQREMYKREHRFIVCARTGTRYEIKLGLAGNVARLHRGRRVSRYCCHVYGNFPREDNILAQKLALEHDEDGFLAKANVCGLADREADEVVEQVLQEVAA